MDKQISFRTIFENVNYWLSFAEAKCAAIIILNMAMITVLAQQSQSEELLIQFFAYLCIMPNLISMTIAAIAIAPSLMKAGNRPWNLLFYADISRCSDAYDYIKKVKHDYMKEGEESKSCSKLEKDYAIEIVSNSKIATRKYKLFKYSAYITIAGFVFLGLGVVIRIIHLGLQVIHVVIS